VRQRRDGLLVQHDLTALLRFATRAPKLTSAAVVAKSTLRLDQDHRECRVPYSTDYG
jgi:hypothetical protein